MKEVVAVPDPVLVAGHVVKDKWAVQKQIGRGAFGEIYKCIDLEQDVSVALKLISREKIAKTADCSTKTEIFVLKMLQGKGQFPKLYGSGKTANFDYVVMQLLGPDLGVLRKLMPDNRFSLSTMLRIGRQMLECIHRLHDAEFIHCDIKLNNFAVGCTEDTQHTVFLIDFGLTRFADKHPDCKKRRDNFRGTLRYASLSVLHGYKHRKVDDLISLFYTLYEMSFQPLPWKGLKDFYTLIQFKQTYDERQLVDEFPTEFKEFYQHLIMLERHQDPNYELLYSVFDRCLRRRGVHPDDRYDFDELPEKASSNVCTLYAAEPRPTVVEEDKMSLSENISKNDVEIHHETMENYSQSINGCISDGNILETNNTRLETCDKQIIDRKNSFNTSKDTGFSASQFELSNNYQSSTCLTSEPDSPLANNCQNKAQPDFKYQLVTEINKSFISQHTESLFENSFSKAASDIDSRNKSMTRLHNDFDLFLKKNSNMKTNRCNSPAPVRKCSSFHSLRKKSRHPVIRSVSHPTATPSYLSMKSIFNNSSKQGLPRCWSCPTISLFIRSDLKPPLKQQASFDENVYEVDVMRNVAAKQLCEEIVHIDYRRNSLPHIYSDKTVAISEECKGQFLSKHVEESNAKQLCKKEKLQQESVFRRNFVPKVQKSLSDSNVVQKMNSPSTFSVRKRDFNIKSDLDKCALDKLKLDPHSMFDSNYCNRKLNEKHHGYVSVNNDKYLNPDGSSKTADQFTLMISRFPKETVSSQGKVPDLKDINCISLTKKLMKNDNEKIFCEKKDILANPKHQNHVEKNVLHSITKLNENCLSYATKLDIENINKPQLTVEQIQKGLLDIKKESVKQNFLNDTDNNEELKSELNFTKENVFLPICKYSAENYVEDKIFQKEIRCFSPRNENVQGIQNHLDATKNNEVETTTFSTSVRNTIEAGTSFDINYTLDEHFDSKFDSFSTNNLMKNEVFENNAKNSCSNNFVSTKLSMVFDQDAGKVANSTYSTSHVDADTNVQPAESKVIMTNPCIQLIAPRRQRKNSESKYVTDQKDLKLNFVRRRHRLSEVFEDPVNVVPLSRNRSMYDISHLTASSIENGQHIKGIKLSNDLLAPPESETVDNFCYR